MKNEHPKEWQLARLQETIANSLDRIAAAWTVDGDAVRYSFTVPASGKGRFVLQSDYHNAELDGKPVSGSVDDIAPGEHTLTFTYSAPARTFERGPSINARTP